MRAPLSILAVTMVLAACTGTILDPTPFTNSKLPGSSTGPGTTDPGMTDDTGGPKAVAASGVRRLTSSEYDLTVKDLLNDLAAQSSLRLPATQYDPFDNDYRTQYPSQSLIEGAEALASDAADRLLADTARRDLIVGCHPTGPADAACLKHFIQTFGRRALRRTLTAAEV